MTSSTQQYFIPQVVLDKYPELVEMLKKSESIDDEEKKYWFGALETMDEGQVDSLKGILDDEKIELEEIENNENEVVESALTEAETEVFDKKREEERANRKKQEKESREEEEDKQDELLSMLDDI
jgi:hypothetical protein